MNYAMMQVGFYVNMMLKTEFRGKIQLYVLADMFIAENGQNVGSGDMFNFECQFQQICGRQILQVVLTSEYMKYLAKHI